jgi:hypothetical protein
MEFPRSNVRILSQASWGIGELGEHARLAACFLHPLQSDLSRYPMGRKGYNGRVERSHRTDDEEFYRPGLLGLANTTQYLAMACRWPCFYNARRQHVGVGMKDCSGLQARGRP